MHQILNLHPILDIHQISLIWAARPKGKRERARKYFFAESDLTYGTARTHTRTNDTKRNDFPVGLTPRTFDIERERE